MSTELKEHIYREKLAGRTIAELATETHYSSACVRKWWRKGREAGLVGLQAARRGRGSAGSLSQFAPGVAEKALACKRSHPKWGPSRVRIELQREPALAGLRVPSRSRLASYFKEHCPECVAGRTPWQERMSPLPKAQAVYEIWPLDCQENVSLRDGNIATICNIRDPFGAVMIASQAFSTKTAKRWRKLEWTEFRAVLRAGFTEWMALPATVQTDNELGLVGSPTDPYPSQLTLWLRGLGIGHQRIRPGRPTDQPEIERNHRTLADWVSDASARRDLGHLQQALDGERWIHNTCFPSQASDCRGTPPLSAHPELLTPTRPYAPHAELALFNLQRVVDYLASFTFERRLDSKGRLSLGHQLYNLGVPFYRELRRQGDPKVDVRLDPQSQEWVAYRHPLSAATPPTELWRQRAEKLDAVTLTGLQPPAQSGVQPVQLSFPCFLDLS